MNKEPIISTNTQNLKEVISYTPLITALLIFFGFLNYDLYYQKLEIDIFSFLETSELIFSFVNLIYPIIIAVIVYNLFLYLLINVEKQKVLSEKIINFKKAEKDKLIEKLEFDYSFKGIYANLKCMLVEFKRKNFRIAWYFFKSIFGGIIFKIINLAIWVFGIVFGFVLFFTLTSLTNFNPNPNSIKTIHNSLLFLMVSIFWVVIIFIYITRKFYENNKKIGKEIYAVIILLVFIANLNVHQSNLASNSINDLNIKNVKFNYKGKNINTNDSKSLIGVTKNYIFLRETSENENLVFKLSDISDIVFYTVKKPANKFSPD